jgi:phage terminase large subunit-like protein
MPRRPRPPAPRWAGPLFDGHVCSLGYEVADWIVAHCCHGPGDVQGDPIDLDREWLDFIVEAYRIDPATGRRVHDEAVLSRPKGRAKSELAGWIGVAEAFAPVRFDGWNADGQPVARPVRSPLLKCLATEESQAGNTFENIAFIASTWGPDVHPDIYGGVSGARQYQSATALYLPHGGEIRASTSGSASKDGGKETWVCADETHLYVLRELKGMYGTVQRNLGKRKIAEPWLMQTTTMYRLGEQSIAEETLTAWRKGELPDTVLVDHREAKGRIDLEDREHTIRQLVDVYGPAAAWHDMDRKYRDMRDPRICRDDAEAARYFLNRGVPSSDAWIATDVVERQILRDVVAPGERIALGFDGSLNDDSTVLIGSRLSDGFLFPVGIWERPAGREGVGWEVPRADVLAAVREAFARYKVTRLYADPHEWRTDIDTLAEELGTERVLPWETRRDVQMAAALDRLHADLVNGVLWHSGDGRFVTHFGNAYVRRKGPHRLVRKENESSARKIDSVVGAALAHEARADALEAERTKAPGLTRVTGRVQGY